VAFSTPAGDSFIDYEAVLNNASRSSSLSHVTLHEDLPAGTSLVADRPVTTTQGTCSTSAQAIDCTIGALKKGESATVDAVVKAPFTSLSNPPDRTIIDTVTGSFDERFSDQPNSGGKHDTATYVEPTLVSATAGQTFVPRNHSGNVGNTNPAQGADDQSVSASIPSASTDVLAKVKVLLPDTFCGSDGTVRIGNKTYICREGGFVDASVTNADTGGTYTNTQHPLVFHLSWGPGLVSNRQTVRNFVVFYQANATAPVQVFSAPCNDAFSNLPCLTDVHVGADGASANLHKADNGHMR
jgi:hypothetical protein